MFAVVISLMLVISTALLLYQFWTRALVEESAPADGLTLRAVPDETAAPVLRTDTAA